MRRCLPILALALLLARPALAQEQPVDAQGDEPPTGAIAPEDDPEDAESAASAVPLEEIKRYVSRFMAAKEAYVGPGRSEERRVGKEGVRACRSLGYPGKEKKK